MSDQSSRALLSLRRAVRVVPQRLRRLPAVTALVALFASLVLTAAFERPAYAASASLTRYPYLTDSIQTSITVNWATTTSASTGSVKWGRAGSCTANTTSATKTSMTVGSQAEYQWLATIPVSPDTAYCYRVYLNGVDLLGSNPSPTFTSQVSAGSTTPFSFAVFGDWGQAYANSSNSDQANVLGKIATSGSRFAVMTGDTAYPNGSQINYGDLHQAGTDVSAVFGPSFWAVPGRSIPVFNVTGNHGFTGGAVQVQNWPEGNAASSSGGRYLMEPYGSINGSAPATYPSMWYAFDAGNARFYILTVAWSDANIGSGSSYQDDADAHWTTSSAEYQWLANDLATHPRALKFAFWHYPFYADSGSQPTDTYLHGGSGTLQGLLDQYGVDVVFNGHAHGYERNAPDAAGMVSYVFGNGGAALGSVSGCHSYDLYAIGSGGSHCGAAPGGQSDDHVFGFAKVTVNGQQVTVTPTDEMGRTYDVQTYTFSGGGGGDTQPPTVPQNLKATAVSGNEVDLSWSASTDNVGVTGYRIYRWGKPVGTTSGTTYADKRVSPGKTYYYRVTAFDAAGNESAKQPKAVKVVTPAGAGTLTFAPTDDATIDATNPTTNDGTSSRIVVDNSPINDMLLKFGVTGVGTSSCPSVSAAKLRLTVGNTTNDNSAHGGDFYGTSPNDPHAGWTEGGVTWNTAPAKTGSSVASLGAVALNTTYVVDVTRLVTGNGTITIRASNTSSDGARYYSRNGNPSAQAPYLQVTCA